VRLIALKAVSLIIQALLLAGLSCGPYSFSGSSLGGIESVYVPIIANETIEYGLGEELTEKITSAFVADNSLKVVDEEAASAIISGKVISYERSPYTYNKHEQVQEYKVDVAVQIKFQKADGSLIWEENQISSFGVFSADSETEEEGKTKALEKLAEIIVNKTVRNW
jgi:outer membrane lipopolysaccharide assembly protein LptE/RlpB